MAGDMDQVWNYCIAISKKFIMALKRELADSHFLRESTTVDFKEYNLEYKKEQSDIDHLLGFKCEVMVINDENVNVVCPSGGKIVVFTELKNFAAVEEIGTVIDHEDKNGSKQQDMKVKKKIMMWKVDKRMEVWWDSQELHYMA
ncbi:hypothetical protein Tco_0594098 [Tanacetum coccineum]